MTVKIVTIMMMMMVTMMTMMMTLSSGEGEHKHSGEVNRPLSATCQPTYNHSRSRKSCDDVGRGDNYCDDDDKDEADDNASLAKLAAVIRCRAEVAAKSSPNAGASLSTWAERLRARSLPQDTLGTSPERSQAGDHMSWGHQMPPFNLSL